MCELSPGASRHQTLAELAGMPPLHQVAEISVTDEDILGWLGAVEFTAAERSQPQFLKLNRHTAMTIDQTLAEADPARVTLFVEEPDGLNPDYLARLQRAGFTLITPWQAPSPVNPLPEPSLVRVAFGIVVTVCLTLLVHQPDWLQASVRQWRETW